MANFLDPTTRTILKHIGGNFIIGLAGLAAALVMDYCADLARQWHRSSFLVFGCEVLTAWLFILDLIVIIGSATVGAIRVLVRLV